MRGLAEAEYNSGSQAHLFVFLCREEVPSSTIAGIAYVGVLCLRAPYWGGSFLNENDEPEVGVRWSVSINEYQGSDPTNNAQVKITYLHIF